MSQAYARHTDPDTSHEAAASLTAVRLNHLENEALVALYHLGGEATTGEIVAESGIEWRSLTPRFATLKRKGLLGVTGKRNRQQVLMLSAEGQRIAESLAPRRTIAEWNASGQFPFEVVDPDGFNRKDPELPNRKFTYREFEQGAMGSTCQYRPGVAFTVGVQPQDLDSLTKEQWSQILDGQMQMKGWLRKRMKRAIRLLTEGRIYDDPNDDGRTGPKGGA